MSTDPVALERGLHHRSFGERLFGALKLDASVYEEVEHDPTALAQAAAVVAIGAVAQAVTALAVIGVAATLNAILSAFLSWLLAPAVVWAIGVKMMEHTSNFPELLRTLGFASAPKLLLVLGVIPLLGWLAALVAWVMVAIAYVIAVRQALDVETGRAVFVCLLAVGLAVMVSVLLGGLSALSL